MTRHAVISPAQADVLRQLLGEGGTNRQIARRLNLTEDTVKSHMRALLAAAKTADRTALAVAVLTGSVTPVVKGRSTWHTTERKSA